MWVWCLGMYGWCMGRVWYGHVLDVLESMVCLVCGGRYGMYGMKWFGIVWVVGKVCKSVWAWSLF